MLCSGGLSWGAAIAGRDRIGSVCYAVCWEPVPCCRGCRGIADVGSCLLAGWSLPRRDQGGHTLVSVGRYGAGREKPVGD